MDPRKPDQALSCAQRLQPELTAGPIAACPLVVAKVMMHSSVWTALYFYSQSSLPELTVLLYV